MPRSKTADFKAVADSKGHRFMFYCQVSGAHVCTTRETYTGSLEEALLAAWNADGLQHFNQCRKCGRWVIDPVYNVEVLECVECAPYEAEPNFCRVCGVRIETPQTHCPQCDTKLIYD